MRSTSQVSVQSVHSLRGYDHNVSTLTKWWNSHIKGVLFGVIYTMAKENVLPKAFDIVNVFIEFIQMSTFCFRAEYHWSGIEFGDITISVIGYKLYQVGFWFCVGLLVLSGCNVAYIAYSFHKGEVRSIYLLKTLRWICSLFVTVLFIPIVYIILAGLACDYSSEPAMLLTFPNVECWGTQHLPIGLIAPFVLVIFAVFSLFTGLTFYEYDPNMTHACCGIQNRFKFIALWIKMLVVFVTLFLHSYSTAFAVISFFSVFSLLAAYLILLPAYDNRINMIRAGSYTGVFWVNICMLVAIGINNSKNYASIVLLAVGLPFAIAIGAFIARLRIKYLSNTQLVDGYVTPEAPMPPAVKASSKKSITWDKPRVNKVIKNRLFGRLLFPTDVEIAARFVLVQKPGPILLEKAKTVYQTGLGKFPNSPTVLQAYANFLFTIVGDWQMGYMILEKLRLMHPAVDIQFFIYRYDKDREHKTEGGHTATGNFIEFMEFKKLHQAAKRFHNSALNSIRKFWRALLESKVDVFQLSELSEKIAHTERKATEQYIRLLELHPKNVRVLRDYARFLDDIVRDEKAAHEIWKKADKYEEIEMARNTESHRSQHGGPGDETPRVHEEDNQSEEVRSEHTSDTSYDDKTVSDSSGISTGLAAAKLEKNIKLKKLSWIMFFTTLFVLIVTFTQLGTLHPELDKYTSLVESLDAAGGSSHAAVDSVLIALDSYVIGSVNKQTNTSSYELPWTGTFADLMEQLYSMSNLFGNDMKSLYWGTSDAEAFTSMRRLRLKWRDGMTTRQDAITTQLSYNDFDHKMADLSAIDSVFNDPIYNQTSWTSGYTVGTYRFVFSTSNLWSMAMTSANYVHRIATASLYDLFGSPNSQHIWFESISYTGFNMWHISHGASRIINLCERNVQEQLTTLILVTGLIFGIAVLLLIIGTAGLFFPVVHGIFQYKIRTLYMFTLIPSSVVRHMIKKKSTFLGQESSGEELSDAETLEEKRIRTPRGSTQSAKETLLVAGEEEEDEEGSSGDEGDGRDERGVVAPVSPVSPEALDEMLASQVHIGVHTKDIHAPSSTRTEDTTDSDAHASINVPTQDEHAVDIPAGHPSNAHEGHFHMLKGLSVKIPSPRFAVKKQKKYQKLAASDDDIPLKEKKQRSPHKRTIETDHSRIDLRSLRSVVRRIHFQYIFPVLCLIVGLTITFVTSYSFLIRLREISSTLVKADYRTLYAHLVVYDISLMYSASGYVPLVDMAASRLSGDLDNFWQYHLDTPVRSSQQDFMYGSECLRIDKETCPGPEYLYYNDVSYGLNNLVVSFYGLGRSLQQNWMDTINGTSTLFRNNPDFAKMRVLSENELFDGLEIITYGNYQYALDQISNARLNLILVSSIEAICFILIHMLCFRPFIKKLHDESDNTHSILRMIPRKLVQDIPEIQQFFDDSIETNSM